LFPKQNEAGKEPMKNSLFIASFILGLMLPKDVKEERAFQIQCPEFTIIVAPASGPTMAMAHDLAEFLGPDEARVCSVGVVSLKRPERKQ
jgi:hypothetical protein